MTLQGILEVTACALETHLVLIVCHAWVQVVPLWGQRLKRMVPQAAYFEVRRQRQNWPMVGF